MIMYFLVFILLAGIPFLLFCLWNFARDLRPRGSTALVSLRSSVAKSRDVPIMTFRTQPQVVHLKEQSRSAS